MECGYFNMTGKNLVSPEDPLSFISLVWDCNISQLPYASYITIIYC